MGGPALRLELRQETEVVHRRHCIHCREFVPELRLRRGSVTCSQECFRADRNERRRYLRAKINEKVCLCCQKDKIFKRDGYRCVFCGATEKLTIDHVKPKSRGGLDDSSNLQTLCARCNSKKGNRYTEPANECSVEGGRTAPTDATRETSQ